jgi:hypothetical protein
LDGAQEAQFGADAETSLLVPSMTTATIDSPFLDENYIDQLVIIFKDHVKSVANGS